MDLTVFHIELLLLFGFCSVLLLGVLLWAKQARMLQMQEEERSRSEEMLIRQEERFREQERLLLHELMSDRAGRLAETADLERRLLGEIAGLYQSLERRFGEMQKSSTADAGAVRTELTERFDRLHNTLTRTLSENRLAQQEELSRGVEGVSRQLAEGLSLNTQQLGQRMQGLTESTDQRLQEISGQVEKRLSEGFDKTTETFTRVLEHLSRIDEAQKRITELSTNVVSLQEVLADKRSRGAFGEVQLNSLLRDLIPERSFSLQHVLSNGSRVDCLLLLPEPTGSIAIDAKFPLENYKRMTNPEVAEADRKRASAVFKQDIRRHIGDIAGKYILPGETADGGVMFIPSESIFSEIHSHYPELVEEACRRHVWLVSPTTMMAILTTASAVLKDAATREQIHVIQAHLNLLSKDFGRFRDRMERLSRHISQAHKDVGEVSLSARKISDRFGQIEKVELDELPGSSQSSAGVPDQRSDQETLSRGDAQGVVRR